MSVLVTGGAGYIGSHMVLELLDAGEKVVVIDNLSTGFRWAVAPGATLVVADIADTDRVKETIRAHGVTAIIHFAGSIVVPEFGHRSARLLLEQHRQIARPDGRRRRDGRQEFHLFLDGSGLRQPEGKSGYGNGDAGADVALRLLEADDRDHARRHREARTTSASSRSAISTSPAPTPRAARASRRRAQRISSRSPAKRRSANAARWKCSAPTIRRPTAPASATTSRSATSPAPIRWRLQYLRRGGASEIFNCGYSKGYSVHEVIAAVKRVSGVDFKVVLSPRRAGDPAAIVAASAKIRSDARLAARARRSRSDRGAGARLGTARRSAQSRARDGLRPQKCPEIRACGFA